MASLRRKYGIGNDHVRESLRAHPLPDPEQQLDLFGAA